MDIVLIAGMWLDARAWDGVLAGLEAGGHHPVALTLPGQGDGNRHATLEDQVAAVVDAVDAAPGPVMVVGHSAACTLAWLAADRRPQKVARAVLIGGMPSVPGETYFDYFKPEDGQVEFPGWEPFEGPDAQDLTPEMRTRMEAVTVPVMAGVTSGTVQYRGEERFSVPVTMLCPEFTPEDAQEWIDAGEVPEVAAAEDVTLVDLDTGHWPMFSKPELLARHLVEEAAR